jgi:guanosine-3',5'-bis(diphosphate) 3'-pyrophosphohydrolase
MQNTPFDTEKKVLSEYRQLLKDSKAISTPEEMRDIRIAFEMVNEACKKTPKKMGEYTIFHALAIARIVAGEIGLGGTSVIASLVSEFYRNNFTEIR